MYRAKRSAFTMIELIFVIVVIGILSAIAIPKFAATRDDAIITKGMTEVAALRSALATERQKRILRGEFSDMNGSTVEGLLEYGLDSTYWTRNGDSFTFKDGQSNTCVFAVTTNRLVRGTCAISAMSKL